MLIWPSTEPREWRAYTLVLAFASAGLGIVGFAYANKDLVLIGFGFAGGFAVISGLLFAIEKLWPGEEEPEKKDETFGSKTPFALLAALISVVEVVFFLIFGFIAASGIFAGVAVILFLLYIATRWKETDLLGDSEDNKENP